MSYSSMSALPSPVQAPRHGPRTERREKAGIHANERSRSRERGHLPKRDHSPNVVHIQKQFVSSSSIRRNPALLSPSPSQAPRAFHLSDQPASFHAHFQRPCCGGIIPVRHFTPRLAVQLPASSPVSVLPSTPPPQQSRLISTNSRYSYLTPVASISSLRTSTSSPSTEYSTPTPSPRLSRSRSHRSSPRPPPPTFLIQRGIVPKRAPPTLAMSIQIHAPSPIMSSRALPPAASNGRSHSSSRPTSPLNISTQVPSPQRPPMARPPSRSERLLRDTLRRAEEHDRLANLSALPNMSFSAGSPPSSGLATTNVVLAANSGRRTRHSTSSSLASVGSDAFFDFQQHARNHTSHSVEDRDGGGVDENSGRPERQRRGTSSEPSSSSAQHYYHESHIDATYAKAYTDPCVNSPAYGTPASPSPARAQLQRSPQSSPNVLRSTQVDARSRSGSHAASHPQSYVPSRTSLDGDRPSCGCYPGGGPITPHEAVLRSRLEGVLKGARRQETREKSLERNEGSSSGSGNSMASSRNRSGEGDWFFGTETSTLSASMTSSASSAPRKQSTASSRAPPSGLNLSTRSPPTNNAALRSPQTPQKQLPSSGSPPQHQSQSASSSTPLTPPPTPPFNARTAAAQCKAMDGYVSFANIEGLGIPDGVYDTDDADEDGKMRGLLKWFNAVRARSNTTGSMVSR